MKRALFLTFLGVSLTTLIYGQKISYQPGLSLETYEIPKNYNNSFKDLNYRYKMVFDANNVVPKLKRRKIQPNPLRILAIAANILFSNNNPEYSNHLKNYGNPIPFIQ